MIKQKMNKIYQNIFIGMGPSTIFSLLKYPQENTLIIEKGKSLKDRNEKEILYGSGGAGTFSDSKLVNNLYVGGNIKDIINITDELFYDLADQILKYYNYFDFSFLNNSDWIPEDSYEIPSDKLKLLKSKVCHIGSDRSKKIFRNIEEYLQKENEIHFEEEATIILPVQERLFRIITRYTGTIAGSNEYLTKNVVIAVGKRSNLVEKIKQQLNLKSINNKVQLGIRVECPNIYFRDLVEKFYDFKIVMESKLGRWRTFCVCAKNAYVTVERCNKMVTCNGAAKEGNNKLINFGIMGELNLNWGTKEQIKLVQKINNGTNKLLVQNIKDFLKGKNSEKLNFKTSLTEKDYRLDNLWKYYPTDIIYELKEFIEELQKIENFNGHLFAPEIKITNPLIEMDQNFQIYPNLFLIGDCSGYSRSIIQSGIIGMLVGKYLKEKK